MNIIRNQRVTHQHLDGEILAGCEVYHCTGRAKVFSCLIHFCGLEVGSVPFFAEGLTETEMDAADDGSHVKNPREWFAEFRALADPAPARPGTPGTQP